MRVLVTGGAGFIGSQICRFLSNKGYEVFILDRMNQEQLNIAKKLRLSDIWDKIKIISGDICDFPLVYSILKENEINKIIHTAAITFIPTAVKNPSLTFKTNVEGSFNMLEASRLLDIEKVLYISTASVYGDFQTPLADEKHPLEPKDIYGATKLAADRITLVYGKTYGMDTSIVRTTSVYGPGDLENRVVRVFIGNALTGKEICLQGGGLQRRDFSYVKDVARGISLALLSNKTNGEVVHIAGKKDYSIKDLSNIISKYVQNTKIIETPGRAVDTNKGKLDISKAKKLFNYEPEYDLEEGVKEYINWFVNVQAPFFELKIINKPLV